MKKINLCPGERRWRPVVLSLIIFAGSWMRALAQTDSSLDHFSWSPIGTPQTAGQAFNASLGALDNDNSPDTNFNGTVTLTGLVGGSPPTVLLTEVGGNPGGVELANVSQNPVDVGGWTVVFYDNTSWPSPRMTFTLPPGTICPAGTVFQVTASGPYPGSFPAFNTGAGVSWFPVNFTAVLLTDAAGNAADFFCEGQAFPALITLPFPITSAVWSGPACAGNSSTTLTYQRTGHANDHNAADWTVAAGSFGALNQNLALPFSAPETRLQVFPASVTLTNGQWSGQVTLGAGGTNVVLFADDDSGHSGGSNPFNVAGLPALGLQIPTAAYKATPGVVGSGNVFIPHPLATNLTVVLSSSLPPEISTPASVSIPAGETNVLFNVTNFNDGLLTGPLTVSILATAPDFAPATAVITNYDQAAPTLSIVLPVTVTEGGAVSGQVISSAPAANSVLIALASSQPGRLQVPAAILLPAGQVRVTFSLFAPDNNLIDGNRSVTVSAAVPGWTAGQSQISVVDNENFRLSLSLPYAVTAGAGVIPNAGTVSISGILNSNVTISLANNFPAKLVLPSSVVIAAGQTSSSFNLTVPADTLKDGDQLVTVTVSATGFTNASVGTTVIDNGLSRFVFASLPASEIAGQPFSVTVYAENLSGDVLAGFAGSASLTAAGGSGPVPCLPTVIGPFTNGIWSGNVTIQSGARFVQLTVDDGSGHTDSSGLFDVVPDRVLSLPAATIVYDSLRRTLLAGLVGSGGQSVVGINPVTAVPGMPIPIGADPAKMVLSGDNSFLYVGLDVDSAGGVVRINLNSQSVDLNFPLGTDTQYAGGPLYVDDMAVQPGNPHTLVVSTKISYAGYDEFMAVYDDGVRRTNVVGTSYYVREYFTTFGASPAFFYSSNPNGLWLNTIGPAGAAMSQQILGPFGAPLVYADGYLYSTAGQAFNTNDYQLSGTFAASGLVLPDPAQGRVYFLGQNGADTTFQEFDRNTYQLISSLNLPNVSGQPTAFAQTGPNTFAFSTSGNQVHLFDTSFIATNSAADLAVALAVSPSQPVLGAPLTYSLTVSNLGPAMGIDVVLTNQIPEGATFVSANSSVGTCAYNTGAVTCSLGDLTNGAVVSVTIVVVPNTVGPQLDVATVDSLAFDPNPGNNTRTDDRPAQTITAAAPVTLVNLPNNDIVYDTASGRIIASVTPNLFGLSNCLVSLDPATGLTGNPVPTGRQPGGLGIARTGRDLYVGLDDSTVRHFDTLSQSFSPAFSLGAGNFAYSMDVLPGAPQTVAVSRYFPSPLTFTGVVLYDAGVPRPATVHSAAIRFSPDGSTLYGWGWNGDSLPNISGDAFYVNQVTTSGLAKANEWNMTDGFIGLGPDSLDVADGLAYFPNGSVLDTTSMVLAPKFTGMVYDPLTHVDEARNQVFFLSHTPTEFMIQQFDRSSAALLGVVVIPNVLGNPARLISCGANSLAFRTDANQIFLIQVPLIPGAAQLAVSQTVSPLAGIVGSNVTYTIIVTNSGLADASNLVLSDTLPAGATFVSAFSAQGSVTQAQGVVTFTLGKLAGHGTATVIVVATPGSVGSNLNTATATADLFDSSSGLNTSALSHWVNLGAVPQLSGEILNVPAADITYDPINQRLLAGVVSGALSNSIVAIGARSNTFDFQLPVGATPGPMALSDDSSRLYVGTPNIGGVSRLNLQSNGVDLTFTLGVADRFGIYTAGDLQAVPGEPRSVAISINHGGNNSGVAIYDDDVARTNVVPSASFGGLYPIRFGADAATLYSTVPFDFRTILVDASGARVVSDTPNLIPGGYSTAFEYSSGRVYFQAGAVVDPVAKTNVGNFPASGPVAPDPANNRVYFLTGSGQGGSYWYLTVRAYDATTYQELWSVPFNTYIGYAQKLIKMGTNGLAFLTGGNRVFVVRTPLLDQPQADVSIQASSAPPPVIVGNGTAAYTFTILNSGPWTATGIVVSNQVPNGIGFVSATSSQGACVYTNGSVLCTLGTLNNGTSATFTLTLRPNVPGTFTNTAVVTLNETDDDPTNNVASAPTIINPLPVAPSVSIGDATALKPSNMGFINFPVTLSGPSTLPISVAYQTADGTAVAGVNYVASSGVVSFAPGQTGQQLNLFIVKGNTLVESNRYFLLDLTVLSNAVPGRLQAVGSIIEDHFRSIRITGTNAAKPAAGVTNILFNLALSQSNPLPVSVQYETFDGTAVAGVDYLAKSGTLVFPGGTTNLTLAVPVLGNSLVESNQTFFVVLSQPVNAVLGTDEAQATISGANSFPPLKILGLNLQGSAVSLRFNTVKGRLYQLEKSSNLLPESWTPVGNQIAGSGSQMQASDPNPTPAGAGYYRLVQLP